MILKTILGFSLCVAAFCAAILMSGGGLGFVLLPGVMVAVLFLPLLAALAGAGPLGLAGAFSMAFKADGEAPSAGAGGGLAVFRLLYRGTLATGCLGFVSMWVLMLKTLSSKEDLLRNIGLTLMPMAYALLVAVGLWLPLVTRMELRATMRPAREILVRPCCKGFVVFAGTFIASLVLVFACFSWGVLPFGFFELGSLSLIVFIPLGAFIAGPGLAVLARSFLAVSAEDASQAELKTASVVFRSLEKSIILAASLGVVLGTAFLIAEWPNRMRSGPTLALALLSLFWGLFFLIALGLPLSTQARRRLALAEGASPRDAPPRTSRP